jgi:hypothetical protein
MRPSEILPQHRETIRELVFKAGMTNPRVFGSVARGEDREDSDLDILVDPAPKTSLLELARLERLITESLGVHVDLLTPGDLQPSFRDRALAEAAPL